MENIDTWSNGIEFVLAEISKNASLMSEYHKKRYYYFKGHLKYFRIPTIIFSAMNSVFSVGLQPYCPQSIISLICCFISLVCGIISSVELFLSVQATMEVELISSKDFYLLSIDIFKMLSLERTNRMVNANSYLDDKYQTYCKLIENSNLLNEDIKHDLKPISQLSTITNHAYNDNISNHVYDIELGIKSMNVVSDIKENYETDEEKIKISDNKTSDDNIQMNNSNNESNENIQMNIINDSNENVIITDKQELQEIKQPRKYTKKDRKDNK
jgi:hypothetical protein